MGEQRGNVYENKGSYPPKAGIALNTKDLAFVPPNMDNMSLSTAKEKSQ
jgi:hypothetical protein